jgi:hypothetical protein
MAELLFLDPNSLRQRIQAISSESSVPEWSDLVENAMMKTNTDTLRVILYTSKRVGNPVKFTGIYFYETPIANIITALNYGYPTLITVNKNNDYSTIGKPICWDEPELLEVCTLLNVDTAGLISHWIHKNESLQNITRALAYRVQPDVMSVIEAYQKQDFILFRTLIRYGAEIPSNISTHPWVQRAIYSVNTMTNKGSSVVYHTANPDLLAPDTDYILHTSNEFKIC